MSIEIGTKLVTKHGVVRMKMDKNFNFCFSWKRNLLENIFLISSFKFPNKSSNWQLF